VSAEEEQKSASSALDRPAPAATSRTRAALLTAALVLCLVLLSLLVVSNLAVAYQVHTATTTLATAIARRPAPVVTAAAAAPVSPQQSPGPPEGGAPQASATPTAPVVSQAAPGAAEHGGRTSGRTLHAAAEDPLGQLRVEAKSIAFAADYIELELHIRRTGNMLAEPFFYAPFLLDAKGKRHEVDAASLEKAQFALIANEADAALRFRPAAAPGTSLTLVLNGPSTATNQVAPRIELQLGR